MKGVILSVAKDLLLHCLGTGAIPSNLSAKAIASCISHSRKPFWLRYDFPESSKKDNSI